MQHELRRVGLVSDDSREQDNAPKITLDLSPKKALSSRQKKSKTKKDLSPKLKKPTTKKKHSKSKNTRIKATKKSSPKKAITFSPKQANKVAVKNLQELGFDSPKHAMNYWHSVKDMCAGKEPSDAVLHLGQQGIKNPQGLPWINTDWKKYLFTVKYIELAKPKGNERKETQQKALVEKQEPQQKEEINKTFRDFDTDTLFERYRNALVSLSKGNLKLSITAQKLIDEINQEFLRRFEGNIDEDGYFIWPSTEVYASNIRLSNQKTWEKDGVLSLYGYRVGKKYNLDENVRRTILDEVFIANIPPVLRKNYIDEWSLPSSSLRLQKMANTLASLTKSNKLNEKSTGRSYVVAYSQREADLKYLYNKYYVGKFGFGWPST